METLATLQMHLKLHAGLGARLGKRLEGRIDLTLRANHTLALRACIAECVSLPSVPRMSSTDASNVARRVQTSRKWAYEGSWNLHTYAEAHLSDAHSV
jgi:hypothetical protein